MQLIASVQELGAGNQPFQVEGDFFEKSNRSLICILQYKIVVI